ncbi:MAG: hypothetical protein AB9842_00245 [Bacteroidales bacterium]
MINKYLFLILVNFIFFQATLKSQTNNSGYDPAGIPVNIARDLNDTLSQLPGINAQMRLPRYFVPFEYGQNVGFIHPATSTTLFVREYPGTAFLAYTSTITEELFTSQGAQLLEQFDARQSDGGLAKVYIMRFSTNEGDGIRIIYFTGNMQTMYYILANTPEVVSTMVRNVLLESFKTLEY